MFNFLFFRKKKKNLIKADNSHEISSFISSKNNNNDKKKTLQHLSAAILHSTLGLIHTYFIHVIFSWSQIGRFGISQREIGVSDMEIFAR